MPRDSSGAYTLPLGNPVIDGTVIESQWANDTMEDIAVQMNNVLTRDGLLGPILPVLFVNGTTPLPGIAFQESPSSGLSRTPPNTLSMSVAGVVRQTWTTTGVTVVGTAGISGDVTIGGNLTVAGTGITFTGPLLLADGTAALPAYSFTLDPNTGMYSGGADVLAFSTGGIARASFDANGLMSLAVPSSPSVPNLMMTAAAGGFGIDIRGRASDNLSVIRLLSNDYTTQLFTVQSDGSNAIIGSTGAIALSIFTNSLSRISINSAGAITFAAPTAGIHTINGNTAFTGTTYTFSNANVYAANFYIGNLTTSAGTYGVEGGLGASMIAWGNSAGGAGRLDLYAGGALGVVVGRIASAVNYLELFHAATGLPVQINANGTDTNVGIQYITKGNGAHTFYTNLGAGVPQFQILHTASAGRYLGVSGSNGANPFITTNAGNIELRQTFHGLGTTANVTLNNVSASTYSSVSRELIQFVNGSAGGDDRVYEMRFATGLLAFRFLNDGYTSAINWLSVGSGFGTGVTNIDFQLSPAGSAGIYALRLIRTNNLAYANFGTVAPATQLQVTGLGQSTAAIFDPATTPTTQGATLFLTDTGTSAGNGGCIMFGAFNGSQPNKHFASIRGYITDASSNTAGELILNTKDSSSDTGSTQALRITADKVLYDNRNLPIARDAGTTASIPIGGIICAELVSGAPCNALATKDASVNNLSIKGTSSGGTNITVTAGTWRNLGATTTSTTVCFWMRIS